MPILACKICKRLTTENARICKDCLSMADEIFPGFGPNGFRNGSGAASGGARKPFPEWVKQATFRNQGGKCNLCSMPLSNYVIEYDHIDNNKTNNQSSNCQALCANCHSEKTKRSG